MPIDETTKKLVTQIVRQTLSEMESTLVAAAQAAGRAAAAEHCGAAHRGLFDAVSKVDAGNCFIIDRLKNQDAELGEIKGIIIQMTRDAGIREGEDKGREARNNVLKALLGSVGLGGIGRWIWVHWFGK